MSRRGVPLRVKNNTDTPHSQPWAGRSTTPYLPYSWRCPLHLLLSTSGPSMIHTNEDDEKCTKYFFQHIRRKKQTIDTLKDHTQTPQTDEHTITDIITDFYTNLYATKSTDDDLIDGLLQHITPVPDKEEEGDLTLEELTRAMRSLSTGKTPGPDGLPAEFYITFWEHLKVCLGAVYNSMYREGKLAPSMTESAVTLLYKGKGDATELRNWRPISLLGSDYKILAKTLMYRLQRSLPQAVGSDQTCGAPGRSALDNLSAVRDIFAHSVERSQPFCLFNLDQEKAFDRVSHPYMLRVMARMNLALSLRNWVSIIYRNNTSKILINGTPSAPIPMHSGVRQGCPLSALLYTIAIEPLLVSIRHNPRITGYPLPGAHGMTVKTQAYMDDITIITTDTKSIPHITHTINTFCTATGKYIHTHVKQNNHHLSLQTATVFTFHLALPSLMFSVRSNVFFLFFLAYLFIISK
uniref:Reverse transcriptase domain-containing protein n=1 Tax=Esox lucius TaxID=8010 RepID=A0AAY5KH43_ESOLU